MVPDRPVNILLRGSQTQLLVVAGSTDLAVSTKPQFHPQLALAEDWHGDRLLVVVLGLVSIVNQFSSERDNRVSCGPDIPIPSVPSYYVLEL